jgi:hypothetical protein
LIDEINQFFRQDKKLRKNAPGPEGIPLEYCYGDGVILDFSDKPVGYGITPEDCQQELKRIGYTLKTPRHCAVQN